ncbi:ComEC/Rec2 family competence protein, partial [Streptomyces sp. NPDC054838]
MNPPEGPGPVDLRLAGPALAAWAAAALALDAPAGWTAAGVGLAVVAAGLLLWAGCRRPDALWRVGTAAAAGLLCAGAGAGVAGLQRAEARAGPVVGLAGEHARVVAELIVGSDPRSAGAGSGPPVVTLDAVLTRVTGPDGARSRAETPVRVLAGHPAWAGLQPSTRVEVVGRLSPG